MSFTTDILYVIGNGFDIHHGLKTSYKEFAIFLKNEDIELYSDINKFIDLKNLEDNLWYKFEEDLARLKMDDIFDYLKNYLPDSLSPILEERDLEEFPNEVKNLLKVISEGIIENFSKFIKNIACDNSGFELAINLKKNAHFLTFNFTKTLEIYYKISPKDICYIHNSPFWSNEPLILGHGTPPEELLPSTIFPPNHLKSKEKEIWEYEKHADYLVHGQRSFLDYYAQTFKHTTEIISKFESFFNSLNSVNQIYVLGHSLSKIDRPYFQKIIESVKNSASWNVTYLDDADLQNHKKTLRSLGISKNKINLLKLSEMKIWNNQLSFNF